VRQHSCWSAPYLSGLTSLTVRLKVWFRAYVTDSISSRALMAMPTRPWALAERLVERGSRVK
jgi:hypothetical protein